MNLLNLFNCTSITYQTMTKIIVISFENYHSHYNDLSSFDES